MGDAKEAEDPKDLERRFMDYRIPGGSERWWAVKEIERLREALERISAKVHGVRVHSEVAECISPDRADDDCVCLVGLVEEVVHAALSAPARDAPTDEGGRGMSQPEAIAALSKGGLVYGAVLGNPDPPEVQAEYRSAAPSPDAREAAVEDPGPDTLPTRTRPGCNRAGAVIGCMIVVCYRKTIGCTVKHPFPECEHEPPCDRARREGKGQQERGGGA